MTKIVFNFKLTYLFLFTFLCSLCQLLKNAALKEREVKVPKIRKLSFNMWHSVRPNPSTCKVRWAVQHHHQQHCWCWTSGFIMTKIFIILTYKLIGMLFLINFDGEELTKAFSIAIHLFWGKDLSLKLWNINLILFLFRPCEIIDSNTSPNSSTSRNNEADLVNNKITFTIGGIITVQLTSCLIGLD